MIISAKLPIIVETLRTVLKLWQKIHLINQMYHFNSKHLLGTFHVGHGSETTISNLSFQRIDSVVSKVQDAIHCLLKGFDVNLVNIGWTEYKRHHIVFFYDIDDTPLFGQVQQILIHKDIVYVALLVCNVLQNNVSWNCSKNYSFFKYFVACCLLLQHIRPNL